MTSIFLAQIFGAYLLIMGFAMIVKRKLLQEGITDLFESKATLFLATLLTLILGIILVIVHPIFTFDWRLVITVLCWLTLIKGSLYLFCPDIILSWKRQLLAHAWIWYLAGAVSMLVGIYLGFCGFFGGIIG